MAFINHYDSIILIGEVAYFVELRNGSIHRENGIGDDEAGTLVSMQLQLGFQVGEVIMLVPGAGTFSEPHSIDNGGVVELVGNDDVCLAQQGLKYAAVGVKTRHIQNGLLGAQKAAELFFKLFVNAL